MQRLGNIGRTIGGSGSQVESRKEIKNSRRTASPRDRPSPATDESLVGQDRPNAATGFGAYCEKTRQFRQTASALREKAVKCGQNRPRAVWSVAGGGRPDLSGRGQIRTFPDSRVTKSSRKPTNADK